MFLSLPYRTLGSLRNIQTARSVLLDSRWNRFKCRHFRLAALVNFQRTTFHFHSSIILRWRWWYCYGKSSRTVLSRGDCSRSTVLLWISKGHGDYTPRNILLTIWLMRTLTMRTFTTFRISKSKICTENEAADADKARQNESAMISRINSARMG